MRAWVHFKYYILTARALNNLWQVSGVDVMDF